MTNRNYSSDLPRWVIRLLRTVCPDGLVEEIEGDLYQRYQHDLKAHGQRKAKRRLWWSALRFIRPGIILRNRLSFHLSTGIMYRNYLKVAMRNLARNKAFSTINISGLVIGITSAALIMLWINNELSYDRFHPDSKRLYEAWNRSTHEGNINCWDVTPAILAPTLKEFPEVEEAISYADWEAEFLFKRDDVKFTSTAGPFTDPGFLRIFNFPLLQGDPEKALSDPHDIVLTERFSKRLFGDHDALGESLTLEIEGNELNFQVSGIMQDLPNNTNFYFDYLLPLSLMESMGYADDFWGNNSVRTYVRLQPNASLDAFNAKIRNLESERTSGEMTNEIFLYPVSELRLHSSFVNGVPEGGRIEVVRLFEIVAFFIILISCINFMNLSTARSESRMKEIGIRKTIGAGRTSLLGQFMTESVLMALFAGLIALLVIQLGLPYFNHLTDKKLTIDYANPVYWGGIAALIVLVGLLAGSYPAVYLSSFRPARVLASVAGRSKITVRRVLVVFQFSFSIILVIAMLVIRQQIQFAQERQTGYIRDKLIYHSLNGDIVKNFDAYRNELLSSSVAASVTMTSAPITERWSMTSGLSWPGVNKSEIGFDRFCADQQFAKTAGLRIIDGRDLDLERFSTDSSAALINETAAKRMELEHPVGEKFVDSGHDWHIVGVFRDFLLQSPFEKPSPMIVEGSRQGWFNMVHIRLSESAPIRESLARATDVFRKYSPEYPFEYHFVDEEYEKKFNDEKRAQNLAAVCGGLSIIISCLGILGLSIFMAQKRIKEIGVRKIFGATILNVITLLSREPVRLMVIALVIASPLAWWAMGQWLERYEYKVSIGWWVFALTAGATLAIVLVTISIQTIRSALANPVESLRHE